VNCKLSRHDARLPAFFYSPVDRILESPVWAKSLAGAGAVYQYVRADAFLSALFLVAVVGVVDYILGIKAARSKGIPWSRELATRGAYGKISGWILLGLVRAVEHWLYLQQLIPQNSRGMFAIAIGISLILVDLQSIANHRESFGAKPIPGLSWVFAQIRRIVFAFSKLPPDPADAPNRRADDPKIEEAKP